MNAKNEIGALRSEIDRLDREIHDRLMRRADVVRKIGRLKRGFALRPGREAMILRALLARHQGALPRKTVARLWREILVAMTRLQSPFRVGVVAPGGNLAGLAVAREHFGLDAPMAVHATAASATRALLSGSVELVLLPVPTSGDRDPWWTSLERGLHVVARLPFVFGDRPPLPREEALVLAKNEADSSGDDVTLVAFASRSGENTAGLSRRLGKAELRGRCVATARGPGRRGMRYLLALDGFVAPDDPRLAMLCRTEGKSTGTIRRLGAYARPFAAD